MIMSAQQYIIIIIVSGLLGGHSFYEALCTEVYDMQISEAAGGVPVTGVEPCRFPKLEECAHFHYERVQLSQVAVTLQTNMDQSLHSQHTNDDEGVDWHMVQVTSADECWLVQRSYENFKMLDAQLHQCIYDRKFSQLPDLSSHPSYGEDVETLLTEYLVRFSEIADNSINCGPVLNWFQMDNKGNRLLVPSEESRSINTPAVAAAYSVRRYVSQARDELSLEVGDMISVIDMASPAESIWWKGKRGFQVGFFPQHCVHIIGDKVPRNMPLPPPVVGSLAITPVKPVLRKHGKLIAFFRSFILNRPSRRRLKQSGILKERVFGCDLGEHLLNSGHTIPTVLKCCTEFIEKHGIVDGIYRLSGVTSNIQKLRNAFDEDRIPDLYTEDILQDIHSVASLLKMYFRELPNPLCTYQLYQSFVSAVQGCNSINRNSFTDHDRLLKMREAVQKLPPPHYRTLEYLMKHLSRVAQHGSSTGMTTRNIAIVWAPNLLRCAELEIGGVAALQGVGVQAVVTEFLICYADLIFCDHLPNLNSTCLDMEDSPKRSRPKSLAISTPTKLITLEEARTKHLLNKADDNGYIEVGGGPNNLPKKYHTIIELPSGHRKRGLPKRSPSGWRSFFSKSRGNSRSQGSLTKGRKASTPGNVVVKSVTETDLTEMKRKLRPVKSAESLTSGHSEPASTEDVLGPLHCLNKPPGHNRSVSHDSYFDTLQSSQHNSEGSLYDLSEIQINFELEESEMRIFSEDESLVSSPRLQKDIIHRRILTRARPEDFNSTNNSNNPSPKKQARVVASPDSSSRKRTRLEDQLSDIQYIDCNTPDNVCVISTTAVVHPQPETTFVESYQPKNKSPRSSDVDSKRQSLNLEKPRSPSAIPKSLTEINIHKKLAIPSNQSSSFTSPQSPNYKQLEDSSTNTTPDYSPSADVSYHNLNPHSSDENEVRAYENVLSPVSKKSSPTYENVLTTISITYRSPSKSPKSSTTIINTPVEDDAVYEDVHILNPEQAVVPTSTASLPLQQASQPSFQEVIHKDNSLTSLPGKLTVPDKKIGDQRPKSLSALEDMKENGDGFISKNPSAATADHLSLTDLTLSEVVHNSTESQSSISFPLSPSKNSLSPNVSPMLFCDGQKTLSQDILTSLSPSVASLLESKTRSDSSLAENSEETHLVSLRSDVRQGNPEYLKLTDNNISSNEEDVSPVRCLKPNDLYITSINIEENPPLSESDARPVSVNLIEFSPCDPPPDLTKLSNDKRKSSETESLDDENSIYQQVKYFRRSIHEINALLDLNAKGESTTCEEEVSETENYDSLEIDNVHVYENVEVKTEAEVAEPVDKPNVRSLTSRFEVMDQKPPVSRRNDYDNVSFRGQKPPIVFAAAKHEEVACPKAEVPKLVAYDRGSLPPCLRARYVKNAIKTRSLDEEAFAKEFAQPLERRKSVDENFGSKLPTLPKVLNQPKPIPVDGEKPDLHLAHSVDNVAAVPEQKLNRERIEKYKEERRKFLHDKYRSESFKEDKDVLLSRLKQKTVKARTGEGETKCCSDPGPPSELSKLGARRKSENDDTECSKDSLECDSSVNKRNYVNAKENRESIKYKTALFENQAKVKDAKVNSIRKGAPEEDRVLDTALLGNDFLRNRRREDDAGKNERRRHTYESREREKELDGDGIRRISLENRSPRKETKSPSYCIKDMKAIFESKSQQ
ncbi:GTPase-activating protein CdGAPr isoform X2 [Photinus pyralis]|uniref:GTPase-activating protein CdGAPr isoform X2 n=1 Tax=Photinus pyralis TaxID=7054 RepID=UPI001267352F|nr:GTPase-activating protein CdGAPr isoform X2 [Photinus pyralis]